MCGIAGIVDLNGERIAEALLLQACSDLRHRGPDDQGVWSQHLPGFSIGLAATRLAVIDPTEASHQPMVSGDGRSAIVFNGLIYNYRELRRDLESQGVLFRTTSDTEVVLAACDRWGVSALDRMNGMWALAFYDRVRRRGFLARDRFGIKPLFWCRDGVRLLFASELPALTSLGEWSRDVNPSALAHYLRMGYVAHPSTIYDHASRLAPAKYLEFDASGVHQPLCYYDIQTRCRNDSCRREPDATARVDRAMLRSVSRRRVADVAVGAFLSGGLDSSIVVAHLAELSGRSVQTFSIGWADQGAYDETAAARRVSQRFGTNHHELICRFDDVLDVLPSVLDHLGEPFFDSSILPTAILSAFAKEHVTVCLSGDGGDELFGGYWRYLAHHTWATYRRVPIALRRRVIEPLMRAAESSKSSMFANRVRQFRKLTRACNGDIFARHAAWSRIIAPEAEDILKPEAARDDLHDRFRELTERLDPNDALNRIMAFDLQYGLPCDMLHKVDLASMLHGLEVRVPFLDPEVVELAMGLPSSAKVGKSEGKTVLRQRYRHVLPEEVLIQPKRGFEVPIGEFLRSQLREMFLDTVDRRTVESFGCLNYDSIVRVYAEHCDRRGEHADLLFALLSLCWWRRKKHITQ